jgi:hypothetical protein
MPTETDYLSNESPASGLGLAALEMYGWSTLDMLSQIQTSGRAFIPWSRFVGGGRAGLGVDLSGNILQTRKQFLSSPQFKSGSKARQLIERGFTRTAWGSKFAPNFLSKAASIGESALAASRLSSVGNAYLMATNPIMFAAGMASNPLALAAGAAWFIGGSAIVSAGKAVERKHYVTLAAPFEDTERSYTSRQRAVRAISESHLQARSAIGNEAQLFHR